MDGLCGQREKGGREVVADLSKDIDIAQSSGVITMMKIASSTSVIMIFCIFALFICHTSSFRNPVSLTLIMVKANTNTKRIIAPADEMP